MQTYTIIETDQETGLDRIVKVPVENVAFVETSAFREFGKGSTWTGVRDWTDDYVGGALRRHQRSETE